MELLELFFFSFDMLIIDCIILFSHFGVIIFIKFLIWALTNF